MILNKRVEFSGHSGAILSLDGFENHIFTGSADHFVARWSLISASQEKFAIQAEHSIYKVKLVLQKTHLILGTSAGSLHIIDLIAKKEIKHFIQHKSAIFEIIENSFKNQLYTTDADGNLAVWNTENWDLLLFIPLACGKIRRIILAENGEKIILACQDGTIKIFETTNFNEETSFQAHKDGTNTLAIFPNRHHLLLSGGKDGYLRVWNLTEGKLISEIPAHNFGIYQVDFFNLGLNFISISRDKSIKLWDSENLKVIQKIERKQGGHSHAVNAFFKKSEFELVTVGDDKRIIYWELLPSL